MKIVLYTNIISPHQLPLARELVKRIGEDNYRYIYSEQFHAERLTMGWQKEYESWILSEQQSPEVAHELMLDADVLISSHRALDIFEERSRLGKKTFYFSERWFKPPFGLLRMFVPKYRRMAKRMVDIINKDPNFHYLPAGVWAQRDMARIGVNLEKMNVWGYFVAPSSNADYLGLESCKKDSKLRVLWVGRMIPWKGVDVLIDAVSRCKSVVSLTLVGDGPEKERWMKLAYGLPIEFRESVPIDEIRSLMREHDVYVLCSNAQEGWGAALNEALEEGMLVLGSNEAGSSATILPASHRFNCRDSRRLAMLLEQAAAGKLERIPIGDWSAARGAERFLEMCK